MLKMVVLCYLKNPGKIRIFERIQLQNPVWMTLLKSKLDKSAAERFLDIMEERLANKSLNEIRKICKISISYDKIKIIWRGDDQPDLRFTDLTDNDFHEVSQRIKKFDTTKKTWRFCC